MPASMRNTVGLQKNKRLVRKMWREHLVFSCWAIVRHPTKQWRVQQMWEVMTVCVIMHNMIIEEERDDSVYDQGWDF
jgi:hypothetical protein